MHDREQKGCFKSHPNIPINTSENELNILVKDRHFENKWKKIIDNNAAI